MQGERRFLRQILGHPSLQKKKSFLLFWRLCLLGRCPLFKNKNDPQSRSVTPKEVQSVVWREDWVCWHLRPLRGLLSGWF